MTNINEQKISEYFKELCQNRLAPHQTETINQSLSHLDDKKKELEDLKGTLSSPKLQNELREDLVRFHLALNHNDTKAARELLVSAAQLNTTVYEGDTSYFLVLASENMGDEALEKAALEGKICFGRNDGCTEVFDLSSELDEWVDLWEDPWDAGVDDWVRPREHVEAYFDDKYKISDAYSLCSKSIGS